MNKDQRMFLLQWVLIFIIFSPIYIFSDEIFENWKSLKWPTYMLFIVFYSLFKDKKNIADTRNIHEYSKNHPWIIFYLALFALSVTATAIYFIGTGKKISNHGVFMLWAFTLLIVPIVFGQQLERFQELGNKSKN